MQCTGVPLCGTFLILDLELERSPPPYNYNTKYISPPRVFDTPSSHSNFNSNSRSNFKNVPHNCTPVNCKVHCNSIGCNLSFAIYSVQYCNLIFYCAMQNTSFCSVSTPDCSESGKLVATFHGQKKQ